ncbi:hypothetical protein HU200_027938 [Digitaria exilis]|uniref:F-box domain-containing protein n=1 Tax=Digitaria exilis TaxID=1010633 RepID=A0A835BWI8_9POAL|nr:hypothetical protein HU200_027938 [Digitaria exilis]
MAPPPPPPLTDDVIGEILLRLPSGDPASLFRASLVCKLWRGLLSDRAFLHRYRAFHRTPPVLGFFHDDLDGAHFVPLAGARSSIADPEVYWCPLDCRHGHVLFNNLETPGLVVWDPITGDRQHLRQPMNQFGEEYEFSTAAVLCASHGCDHLECRGGPYLVVFAGTDDFDYGHGLDDDDEEFCVVRASVYSSETGAWSKEVLADLGPITSGCEVMGSSLLARDMIYFTLEEGERILEYDLVRHVLSVIDSPISAGNMILIKAEDGGGLGIAEVNEDRLQLWRWKIGPWHNGHWQRGRVIKLGMMISIATGNPSGSLDLVGFAEGTGSIFVRAEDGMFIIELKPDRVRKVAKRGDLRIIHPFASFYTPGTN